MSRIIFSVFLLFVSFQVSANDSSTYFKDKNYDAAYRAAYADALSGDSKSQFIIGRIIMNGLGSSERRVNEGAGYIVSSSNNGNVEATIYLAKNYESGEVFDKNLQKALLYYRKAAKQGSSSFGNKIFDLTQKTSGTTSKQSCQMYSKKDETRVSDLIKCHLKGHIKGNIAQYYLWNFDQTNDPENILEAAKYLTDENSEYFNPELLISYIPLFRLNASQAQTQNWLKFFNSGKYSAESCASKTDGFGFTSELNVNDCIFAAEANFTEAIITTSKWWSNGKHGLPRNLEYSQLQISSLDGRGSPSLQLIPLKEDAEAHYIKLVDMMSENPFLLENLREELAVEVNAIIKGEYNIFSRAPREEYRNVKGIKFVLKNVDFAAVDHESYAQIHKLIHFNDTFISNSFNVDSDILRNLYFDDFSKDLFDAVFQNDDLNGIKYLEHYVAADCEALSIGFKFAEKVNPELLALAQTSITCDQSLVGDTLEVLAKMFETNPNRAVQQLNTFLLSKDNKQCEYFEIYIKAKELNQTIQSADEKLTKEAKEMCLNSSGIVSAFYGKKDFANENYNDAYQKLEASCDLAVGEACGYQAYLYEYQNVDANKNEPDIYNKRKKALSIARRGCDLDDEFACLIRYDILGRGVVSGLNESSKKERKSIISRFVSMGSPNAKIRLEGACIEKFGFLVDCSKECRAIQKIVDKQELDFISSQKARKYLKHSRCE